MGNWLAAAWPAPARQAAQFAVMAAALGIGALVVGESLPRKWFRYDGWLFRARAWERDGRIYNDALRVKAWKDKVPDNSRIFPFLFRKKVARFHDPAYSLRLLQETCVAEAVHWGLIVLSPVFLVFLEPPYAQAAFAIYDVLFNLPFIVIQRYNRPRLARLYEKQLDRQKEAS